MLPLTFILANFNSHKFFHLQSNRLTLYNQESYASSYEPLVSFIYSVLYVHMYILSLHNIYIDIQLWCFQIFCLAAPPSKLVTTVFRLHLHMLSGAPIAILFPVINTRLVSILWLEVWGLKEEWNIQLFLLLAYIVKYLLLLTFIFNFTQICYMCVLWTPFKDIWNYKN